MVTRPEILRTYTKIVYLVWLTWFLCTYEVERIYSVMANVSTSVIMNPVVQDIYDNGL